MADLPQVGERDNVCDLFAGAEYGWPLWRARSLVARTLVLGSLAVIALTIKLIHPLHPYRIYTEGSVDIHRHVAKTAGRVPTRRPSRAAWAMVALVVIAAYLGVSELFAFRPVRGRL